MLPKDNLLLKWCSVHIMYFIVVEPLTTEPDFYCYNIVFVFFPYLALFIGFTTEIVSGFGILFHTKMNNNIK